MPTVNIRTQVSLDELVNGVKQLSDSELDQFISRVMGVKAGRTGESIGSQEADLIKRINEGLLPEEWERFHTLEALRKSEKLKPEEQQELIAITDRIEQINFHRLQYLIELSKLKGKPVEALIEELQLTPAPNA
jgi:hypothetical protein